MPQDQVLILSYIAFVWLVILHTLEEIACGVMEVDIEHIKMTRNRYLFAASAITSVNLGALALLVLGMPAGYYMGLFTSAVIGVFQAIVHSLGYLREGKRARGMGAGFYSSIPLAAVGLAVLVQIARILAA